MTCGSRRGVWGGQVRWLDAETGVGQDGAPSSREASSSNLVTLTAIPPDVSSCACSSILPGRSTSTFPSLSDLWTVAVLPHKAQTGALCCDSVWMSLLITSCLKWMIWFWPLLVLMWRNTLVLWISVEVTLKFSQSSLPNTPTFLLFPVC